MEVYNQCDLHMPEQLPDRAIAVSAKTGFHISELKEKMAVCYQKQAPKANRSLLGNFVQQDDIILLVTPIDESAPKGRMILPQVQAIRSILDEEAICLVVQPQQLQRTLLLLKQPPKLVVTDSQAFQQVNPDCSAGNRPDFIFYLICTLSRCTAKGSDCRRYAGIFAEPRPNFDF